MAGIFDFLTNGWGGRPGVFDTPEARFAAQNAQPEQPTPRLLDQATDYWNCVGSGEVARQGIEDVNQAFANRDPVALAGSFGPSPLGIRAFHGSPHSFDRFDLSKIGTGEGAQAYGHGLYFAESEPVARSYRDALVNRASDDSNRMLSDNSSRIPTWMAKQIEQYPQGHEYHGAVIDNLETLLKGRMAEQGAQWSAQPWMVEANIKGMQEIIDHLGRIKSGDLTFAPTPKGSMYEVEIKGKPEDFLNWDQPLSRNPVGVQEALGWTPQLRSEYDATTRGVDDALFGALKGDADPSAAIDALSRRAQEINRAAGIPRDATGADIVKGSSIFDRPSDAARAAALRQAGIPGVRYLDQGSRGVGQGTSNYAVFDDSLIQILRKYGLLPPLAAGGALGFSGANNAQY